MEKEMGGLQTGLQKEEDKAHIAAVIRYTFTDDTRNIYESFNLSQKDNNKPDVIIARLEKFVKGLINETLERHIFNPRKQEDGECFDDFLTELKLLSKNCNYCEGCYPGLLRDKIVAGIQSDVVRKKLLSGNELTVEKAINVCRASEKASKGMESLKNDEQSEVAWLKGKSKYGKTSKNNNRGMKIFSDNSKCKFCVRTHPFGRTNCPAWGKKCFKFQGMNHFAKSAVCGANNKKDSEKGKGVNEVQGVENEVGALFLDWAALKPIKEI